MKRIDTIYRRTKEVIQKTEVKRGLAFSSVFLIILGIFAFFLITFSSSRTVIANTTNLIVTSADIDDVYDATMYNAIVSDGSTNDTLTKGENLDAPFQTLSSVQSVTSATLYYDSSGTLSGTWGVYLKDSHDGTTICSVDPAPEDGSETRNNIDCSSITPTQLFNGVWLQMDNNDNKGPQSITLDYAYLYVDYTPAVVTIDISGTCDQYDQSTDCTDDGANEIAVASALGPREREASLARREPAEARIL